MLAMTGWVVFGLVFRPDLDSFAQLTSVLLRERGVERVEFDFNQGAYV